VDGDGLARGNVGCPEGDTPHLTGRFGASVFWLSPEPFDMEADAEGLKLRCATQETPCRIAEIRERVDSGSLAHLATDNGRLEGTEVGEVVLEVAEPLVLESFYDVEELGRFVLVRNKDVVAGGIVTHPGE
jgi:sulfate adenylyltransferase subunit 1 (EFTu-like GTPase family)